MKPWTLGLILVGISAVIGGAYYYQQNRNAAPASIALDIPAITADQQTIAVPLHINTKAAVNAGEFYFSFPTDILQVKEIKKDDSFFALWIKDSPSFSNTDGTISLAGGLPSPGFIGNNGLVATVVFDVKHAGQAKITLDESRSRLLANDGLGTKVAASFKPVTLTIK
jgi:hypothetical protein